MRLVRTCSYAGLKLAIASSYTCSSFMIVLMSSYHIAIPYSGNFAESLKTEFSCLFVARLQSFANLGKVIPQLLIP